MKIVFDYSIFFHQNYGGITRYFLNLYNKLIERNVEAKIIAPLNNNIFLKNHNLDYFSGFYIKNYPRFTRKLFKQYNHMYSKLFTKIYKPNIIHKTFYEKNFTNNNSIKKIITVYDLVHEIYFKEYNNPKDYRPKKIALENIDFIICPSNKTKLDLMNFYNMQENKIKVIYMAPHNFKINMKFKNNFKKPYILFVGERKRYKNFINFIKAYSLSNNLQKDFSVVCCGGGKISANEKKIISELKIDISNIIQIDGNDNILNSLYLNASAFVFPSMYEGLGLPPLEAMSLGCPVITSNHEAIIEGVGDAAVLFNPKEPEDIKNKIEDVLYSEELKKKLRLLGINRSKLFSWDKCANETLEVYNQIS